VSTATVHGNGDPCIVGFVWLMRLAPVPIVSGRFTISRRNAGGGRAAEHVDLLQLVDAQESSCAKLIEESHAAMRHLLQTGSHGRAINTAQFSERLNAQFEHLHIFLVEERIKLQDTLAGTPDRQGLHVASLTRGCLRRRSASSQDELRLDGALEEGKQVWWSRRFRSRSLEHAYRQHHLDVWRPRVRGSACLLTAVIAYLTVLAFLGGSASGDPGKCAPPAAPRPPNPPAPHPPPRSSTRKRVGVSTPQSLPSPPRFSLRGDGGAHTLFCFVLPGLMRWSGLPRPPMSCALRRLCAAPVEPPCSYPALSVAS